MGKSQENTCYDSNILRNTLNKIFDVYLQNKETIEILINQEKQIITETSKGFHYHHHNNVKTEEIVTMCTILAHENGLDFNNDCPTLSVDCLYKINEKVENIRISGVFKKFTENGICLSIRKKNPTVFTPKAFFNEKTKKIKHKKIIDLPSYIAELPLEKKLKKIFENNQSVIIAGATSTGKTSCLNTIIKYYIPKNKRIISVEDTREITCEHKNCLQIINRDSTNIKKYLELLNITIRLRPDWLIIGEIRNKMASIFLNFASSGHPAITTLHASSPEGAIERLADLIQLEGSAATKQDIEKYIANNISYIIQLKRGKKRQITSEIYQISKDKNNLLIEAIK